MGKRADVIIILDGIIFVVEFKIDAEAFTAAAIEQATDYASDLKYFHTASHDRIIIPVVVASDAPKNLSSAHHMNGLLITRAPCSTACFAYER